MSRALLKSREYEWNPRCKCDVSASWFYIKSQRYRMNTHGQSKANEFLPYEMSRQQHTISDIKTSAIIHIRTTSVVNVWAYRLLYTYLLCCIRAQCSAHFSPVLLPLSSSSLVRFSCVSRRMRSQHLLDIWFGQKQSRLTVWRTTIYMVIFFCSNGKLVSKAKMLFRIRLHVICDTLNWQLVDRISYKHSQCL